MFICANDYQIRELLVAARTIAVVGLSPNPKRPSNRVARYLIDVGYRVIPVNPGQDRILDQPCFSNLDAVPQRVDIVNIFRKPADVPAVVAQAIANGAGAIWMQQNIVHEEAARQAESAGVPCIMDRCIMIDHQRLLSGSAL